MTEKILAIPDSKQLATMINSGIDISSISSIIASVDPENKLNLQNDYPRISSIWISVEKVSNNYQEARIVIEKILQILLTDHTATLKEELEKL